MAKTAHLPRKVVEGKSGRRGFELAPEVLNDTSDVLTFLRTRRSAAAADITVPGPGNDELALLLEAAARVPDHGKLVPWRFVVYRGRGREALARLIDERRAELEEEGRAPSGYLDNAALVRAAPVVVAIISHPCAHPRIPVWEQELSAAAACMNLLCAAIARGWAAQWRTGWMPYDATFRQRMGLEQDERIAGFIHIGTRRADAPALTDRRRPFWQDITTFIDEEEGA